MSDLSAKIYRGLSIIKNRIPFINTGKEKWIFSRALTLLKLRKSTTDSGYFLTGEDFKIFIRNGTSDEAVFRQIFIEKEYECVVDTLKINNIEVRNIIDAGANIGLSSIIFSRAFPNAEIISIEPDPGNFRSLEINVAGSKVYPLEKALWNSLTKLEFSRDFRDGKEWSIQVKEAVAEKGVVFDMIETITITSLLQERNWKHIDLLKVDIEGAEQFIFNEKYALDYLECTKCLALEIHDEFNIRDKIYDLLLKRNFMLFENGELTIALNKNYCK